MPVLAAGPWLSNSSYQTRNVWEVTHIYIMDTISRLDTVRSRKIGKRKTAFRFYVMTLNSPKNIKHSNFARIDLYIYVPKVGCM